VLKEKKIKINRQQVKEWLASQEAYTMHRRMLKKFHRNKGITRGIDDLWQIDLADMQNISKYNDNFRYLVTCIDVFSKFAWVIPIKNKQAKSVLEAFKIIIENSSRKPNNLQSDQGTEFLNKEFKEYLEEIGVGHYYVNSELKASVVERFNRTIKEKIYRYFTYKNTYDYISVLGDLVQSYNNSFHRSIKTSPNLVNKNNEKKIHKILYGSGKIKKPFFKFKIGEQVRITKYKSIFEKGFTAKWTEEIFRIRTLIPREPIVYKLEDLNGEEIKGVFYEPELQKVIKDIKDPFVLDKVLKTKTEKGEKKYFVSWRGYPPSFNSWITDKDFDEEYFK
jgi:transposase InsO family protein